MKRSPLIAVPLFATLLCNGCSVGVPIVGYLVELAIDGCLAGIESATGQFLEKQFDNVLHQFVALAPKTYRADTSASTSQASDKLPPLHIVDTTHAVGEGVFNFKAHHNGHIVPFSIDKPNFVRSHGEWKLDPHQESESLAVLDMVDKG